MRRLSLLAALVAWLSAIPAYGLETRAADLARGIRDSGLNREECYRVRDLTVYKEDIKLYFTDGYLIFSKPVEGLSLAVVFTADVEGGDAEVIVLPPHRAERLALSTFTHSPNLDEHFKSAVMIATDGTASRLLEEVRAAGSRKSSEMGVLLEQNWNPVLRNLYSSLDIRLVQDLLSGDRASGMFYGLIGGSQQGNFDVIYDPQAKEQITLGQVAFRDQRPVFNIWSTFVARSYRKGEKKEEPASRFSLSNFRIDATLEPDLNLKAVTRVTLKPRARIRGVLGFELSRRMRVGEARIDGEPAEVFQRDSLRANLSREADNDLFLIVTRNDLEPGRAYELEFRHEGAVISPAGNQVYYVGARGNWYPHRGQEFAQYHLTFRYPNTLGLIATGELVSEGTEGNRRIAVRKTTSPVRLAGFNLGDYEKVSLTRAGYQVEVYGNRRLESALQPKPRDTLIPQFPPQRFPNRRFDTNLPSELSVHPPNPLANLQTLAADVAAAVDFMSAQFGAVPVKTLAVSPIPGGFGQGFPGLIYLSTLAYLAPQERPAAARDKYHQTFFSEILTGHETAHQWWGNLVTSAGYESEWLMEALANYSALLLYEKRKGARALEGVLDSYREHLLAKGADGRTVESTGPITWGLRLNSTETPQSWRLITYEKGSWIIHMLRRRLGDDQFFRMLGELSRRYRYRSLSTEQFREFARGFVQPHTPDRTLENFFASWVYSTGVPALKLTYSTRGNLPNLKLTGTVTQSDVDDEFGVDVPVEIHVGRGKVLTHWVRSSSEPVSFSVSLHQAPSKVQLSSQSNFLHSKK